MVVTFISCIVNLLDFNNQAYMTSPTLYAVKSDHRLGKRLRYRGSKQAKFDSLLHPPPLPDLTQKTSVFIKLGHNIVKLLLMGSMMSFRLGSLCNLFTADCFSPQCE